MVWNGGKWSKVEYSAPIKRGVRNAKPPYPHIQILQIIPQTIVFVKPLYPNLLIISQISVFVKHWKT